MPCWLHPFCHIIPFKHYILELGRKMFPLVLLHWDPVSNAPLASHSLHLLLLKYEKHNSPYSYLVSFLSLTLITFKHSFLLSMGRSGGKPDSHSILPVAHHFRNILGLYRSYSESQSLHRGLAPEQFLGTIKRKIMMITLIAVTTIIIICSFQLYENR